MKKITIILFITVFQIASTQLIAAPFPSDYTKANKLKRYSRSLKPRKTPKSTPEPRKSEEKSESRKNSSEERYEKTSSYQKSLKVRKKRTVSRPTPHRPARRQAARRRFRRKRYYPRFYSGPLFRRDTVYVQTYSEPQTYVRAEAGPPPLTEEEITHTNQLLDRYEDWLGLFQLSAGMHSNLKEDGEIMGQQGVFRFNAPHSYDNLGKNVFNWGLLYKYKNYKEDDYYMSTHQAAIEGRATSLFRTFASSWGADLGIKVFRGLETSAGLLFGLNYSFFNLHSFYSFHIGYEGTIFNLTSKVYKPVLESNIESYFRFYLGPLHMDVGGELNVIDIEQNNYFHQFFARTGIRL